MKFTHAVEFLEQRIGRGENIAFELKEKHAVMGIETVSANGS